MGDLVGDGVWNEIEDAIVTLNGKLQIRLEPEGSVTSSAEVGTPPTQQFSKATEHPTTEERRTPYFFRRWDPEIKDPNQGP